MKKPISLFLSMALAAGLLVVALAPAFASEDEVSSANTSTSMSYNKRKDKFRGMVGSGRDECVGHRTVKVYKITRSGNKAVGTASTDSSGAWSEPLANARGKYGAKVLPMTVTLDFKLDKYGELLWQHLLECKAATASVTV